MSQTDPISSFRYTVEIDNQLIGAFTECTMPSFEIEVESIKEGGQNEYIHAVPGRAKPGNVTLKHGIMVNDQLMVWAYQTMANLFGAEKFKNVSIVMYNNNHKPIYRFDFNQAYPVKWQGPSLKSSESAVAIETLELAHHGVTFTYQASGAT
jgi:phage tail-like protein